MAKILEDPHSEYVRRLQALNEVADRLEKRHVAFGNAQLAVTIAAALGAWLAFGRHWFSGVWLLVPAGIFAVVAALHSRVLHARRRADRSTAFYDKGLARIEDRWHGQGEGGLRFNDSAHPYAEDLDLFGPGSLFELVSTARLRTGEETLARWLLAPAPIDELRLRQAAADELRPRLDLREDLALGGADANSAINPGSLSKWAEQPIELESHSVRIAALILAALSTAGAAVWAIFGIPEAFLVVLGIEAAFFFKLRARVLRVIHAVGEPAYGLALFAAVLARFEHEKFQSPRLLALQKQLTPDGVPPSQRIARLNRLMELLDSSEHWVLRLIDLPLLYRVQLAFAVEGWRKKSGGYVRGARG